MGMANTIRFPKKFLWGAGVSAHQVEGDTHNQWTAWELEQAKARAAQAPYHYGELESWPSIKALAGQPANYVSARASGHYTRYKEDLKLLKKLGLNTFRFSIEWSRLEPEEGKWDEAAIEHYRDYFAYLKQLDITPVVTLFHFTLPEWFANKGGFAKRRNLVLFERFATKVLDEYGPYMKWIITVNEPTVYVREGYLNGNWPPGVSSKWQAWRVLENLVATHRHIAKLVHAKSRRLKVSMAHHISYVYPGDDAWLTRASSGIINQLTNHYVLARTVRSSDFLGVNYYASRRIYGYRVHNPDVRLSDMGWDMQPGDLRYVLDELWDRYKKPLMITENGLADAADTHRGWWLQQTIAAMYEAMGDGVDLLGYIHWSLLDNFEWSHGRWPRFGLVAVDYKTLERMVRPSARALARIIKKIQGDR